VLGQVFATDQAGFLAGYLAAGVTKTGKIGTFGGIQIPTVTVFMDGYALGAQAYNERHGTNVEVLVGIRRLRPACSPATSNPPMTAALRARPDGRRRRYHHACRRPGRPGHCCCRQERGNAYIIGVDSDWYLTAPDYKDIVLTSVMKLMDVTTFNAIQGAHGRVLRGRRHPG